MKTHEQLVREIAEEIVRSGRPVRWLELLDEEKEYFIEREMPTARIAVRHMAESFSAGYNQGCYYPSEIYYNNCNDELIEMGLIPRPEHYPEAYIPKQGDSDLPF